LPLYMLPTITSIEPVPGMLRVGSFMGRATLRGPCGGVNGGREERRVTPGCPISRRGHPGAPGMASCWRPRERPCSRLPSMNA
jgi:hypothetical protein